MAHNSAAQVISWLSKKEQITPTLLALHWLPVGKWIECKLLCLVYEALDCQESPSYMRGMLSSPRCGGCRRSGDDCTHLVAPAWRNDYGKLCTVLLGECPSAME